MPITITMPALSPTMTEGTLAKWLVQEGDTVQSGDIMAEIETDKATMEVEAVDEGVIAKLLVPEGTENVAVNAPIAVLLEEGEEGADLGDIAAAPPAAAPAHAPAPAPGGNGQDRTATVVTAPSASAAPREGRIFASPVARRMAGEAGLDLAAIAGSGPDGRIVKSDVEAAMAGGAIALAPAAAAGDGRELASPLARRMAAQAGLDLGAIQGSGPQGRVVKGDIEAALAGAAPAAAAPAPAARAPAPPRGAPATADFEELPLNSMRKTIARRLTESKQTVPHFYLTIDCEVDKLLEFRREMKASGDDVRVSVNDFVIKAAAMALAKNPDVNSQWNESSILRHNRIDVSVAVALDGGGLITPVVRDADQKGLARIAAEMQDLAGRARDGKLMPEDYQGGTFSISNLGMFGVDEFVAVINPPQAAILAVGAGVQRPVVKDGAVTVATVMSATLSGDHRVFGGAEGARFLADFRRMIEQPISMLL